MSDIEKNDLPIEDEASIEPDKSIAMPMAAPVMPLAAPVVGFEYFPILIIDEAAAWGTSTALVPAGLPVVESAGSAVGGAAAGIGLSGAAVLAAGAGVLLMTGDTIRRATVDTLEARRQNKISKAETYGDSAYIGAGVIKPTAQAAVSSGASQYVRVAQNVTRVGNTDNYEVKNIGIASSMEIDAMYQAVAASAGLRQIAPINGMSDESIGSFMEAYLKGSSADPTLKKILNTMNILVPSVGGVLTSYVAEGLINSMFGHMRQAGILSTSLMAITNFVTHTDFRTYTGTYGIFSLAMVNGQTYNGVSYYPSPDESTLVKEALARAVVFGNAPTNLEIYWGRRNFYYDNQSLSVEVEVDFFYVQQPARLKLSVIDDGTTVSGTWEERVERFEVLGRYRYTRSSLTSPWQFSTIVKQTASSAKTNVFRVNFSPDHQCCSFGSETAGPKWVEKTPGVAVPEAEGATVESTYPEWHQKRIQVATGIDAQGDIIYTDFVPLTPTVAEPQLEPPSVQQAQSGIVVQEDGKAAQMNPDAAIQRAIEEAMRRWQKQLQQQAQLPQQDPTTTTTPPDEGTGPEPNPDIGSVPEVELPKFEALDGDFYNMYKTANLSQLRSFNGWLWSTDIIDNILRLFQKPLDSILALGVAYVPYSLIPARTEGGINIGNMTYSTSIDKITNQVISLSCGSVYINYFYNNALDYEPYTRVGAYLPFVGEVEWSCADVMNSQVEIKYNIDLLTGSSLCIVTIKKPGGTSVPKYVYECNTMTNIPLSGNDYSRLYASLATAALGVGAGLATGNPVMAASSALGFITGSEIPVFKSGGLSSNAGSLGPRAPFVIINRRNMAMPANYNKFIGYPVNGSYVLGSLKGFTRVSAVHLDGVPATRDELDLIEAALKEGVIL